MQDPGVFGAATLRRIHHQRAVLQRHARQAAGHHLHLLATEHKGPQVDMARRHTAFDIGRARRQTERGLRNVARGIGQQHRTEFLDFCRRGGRPHEHAVTARAMDFLHHQVLQMGQRVLQVFVIAAHVGRHVVQDGLFTQIELDHFGHVGVNRFVIGHAGTNRVAQRHVAAAVHIEQTRAAER